MKRFFLLIVRFFYSSISLIFTLLTAKLLTRDDYKQSVELIVALSIMAPIVSFGIGPLIVRKGKSSTQIVYRRALNGWCLGVLLSLILGLISYWLYPDIYIYIFMLLVLNNTSFIISECYRSQNDFFRALLFSNGSPSSGVISLGIISNFLFLVLGAIFFVLKIKITFSFLLWGTICSILITVLYDFYKHLIRFRVRITKKWLYIYSKSAFNISLIYFLFSFISNSDLLIISNLAVQNIIYDYSLAFKLSASCLIIHTFFASMSQVEFVKNNFLINSAIKKMYFTSISVSLFSIITLNIVGVYMLRFLGVEPHNEHVFRLVMLIKSLGAIFYITLGFNASFLLITNRFKNIIISCLVFVILFISVAFLSYICGVEAWHSVLYSWLMSYLVYSLLLFIFQRKGNYNG